MDLQNHMVKPNLPSDCFRFRGTWYLATSMMNSESNELATIPTVLDLLEVLCASVHSL